PLFTLFVSRPEPGGRDWIGWSPLGPYDAGDRRAERHLGWHFPAAAGQPVKFAQADQAENRAAHFKPGVLADLMQRGEAAAALADYDRNHARAATEPQLTVWLQGVGPDPRKA